MNNESLPEELSENLIFQMRKKDAGFDIAPFQGSSVENDSRFTKLKLNSAQKTQISSLLNYLPGVVAMNALSNMYVVRFPEGLPHTLMNLSQGGFGSAIMGEKGIVGQASFYKIAPSKTIIFGTFTTMSVITGQYFLTKINKELNQINVGIDKVLDFLYGDKRAELASEVSFVNYAYKNYLSIMAHKNQTVATITNLQKAAQIAAKDCEFYISDLKSTTRYSTLDSTSKVDKAFKIKDSIETALQLYVMSNIMEAHYSQNYDEDYLKYIEEELFSYIAFCNKGLLSAFRGLIRDVDGIVMTPFQKADKNALKEKVEEVVDSLEGKRHNELKEAVKSALSSATKSSEYYIDRGGNVYMKTSD